MSGIVSVIMACYNAEKTLSQAVESILCQTFRDFEFIIVNDASTDNTTDILHYYQARDNRVILVNNDINIGLAASLNRALLVSKGRFIARMDADDVANPKRLEKQLDFMLQHSAIDVLGTAIKKIDRRDDTPLGVAFLSETHDDIVSKIFIKPPVYHPTIMIKKSVFEAYGYYDENIRWGEDADLWYRIYDKVRFHNLPDVLLTYRVKSRLDVSKAVSNLKNKCSHLKRRNILAAYIPVLLKDALTFSFRILKNY